MISLSYLLDRIKDVKFRDYLSLFPMTVALLFRPFYRKKYEGTWLVCEEPAEARDNGYHFFKYMCEKQPQQKCFYAIMKSSVDYRKAAEVGDTIEYGSVQHWLAYFLTDYNISSQKGGKPNAAMCAFMEMNGRFKPKNVFLQHGVIINNLRWLYADRSKIDLFITSTIPEMEYVQENFGYKDDVVQLTGLPRFDALHDVKTNPKQIVIMPTWRYWFNLKSKEKDDLTHDFMNSAYLRNWKELLESEELNQMIEEYRLNVIFYPHRNMQRHLEEFKAAIKTSAKIASWKDYDIQELLKSSEMMVTDYSSVFYDMIYMKKPVVFYQFDYEDFRKGQYKEGYFDYKNNPFGKSFSTPEETVEELKRMIGRNFKCDAAYIEAHTSQFPYYDAYNCERVFDSINLLTK